MKANEVQPEYINIGDHVVIISADKVVYQCHKCAWSTGGPSSFATKLMLCHMKEFISHNLFDYSRDGMVEVYKRPKK